MSPARRRPDGLVPLVATLLIQALVSLALLALPVIAPIVSNALGISTAYVGLYVALAYAGAMLSSLLGGAVVARYGALRVSQSGLILCAAGLALCALPSVPAIALGAVLIGLGYGPITPASSHLLVQTTPAHRMSLVFSIKQTGVPLGGALAGATVPLLETAFGWRAALLIVAGLALLTALLVQPLRAALDHDRDPTRPLRAASLFKPMQIVFSQRSLGVLAFCSLFFSATQLSLTSYLVTFLHDGLDLGLVAAGLALSVAQVGGMAGRIFWGYAADRMLGAPRMLALIAIIMMLGCLGTALLQSDTPWLLLLTIVTLFGATAIGWNGVFLAEVARQAPAGMAGLATGGTLAVTYLGVVLGPPAFGALSAAFGSYRVGYAALALPAICCGMLLLRYREAFERARTG